jgi:NADH-quinone oxidoreductase subunit L
VSVLFPALLLAIPALSFVIIIFFGKYLPVKGSIVGIIALGLCFVLSFILFINIQLDPYKAIDESFTWFTAGNYEVKLGFLVDKFASTMAVVITLVTFLIHIYSVGYMKGDPRFTTFFAYLSLFSLSILGIIIANNYLMVFIFWELVGLSSYLLIGFWFHKDTAADAGKKAFIVNRIGDFGFLIGIFLLFTVTGSFGFKEITATASYGGIPETILFFGILGIFCGAIGKSAQLPLYVWLPDAMEGPTPVSALIHAATMVAAGVYLVARSLPLFSYAPQTLEIVAWIGGLTALYSATMALAQTDIKRILAYSTISQLGYMMLGAGVGSSVAAIFHLSNHAFFKALLFLGAGSVIHAVHSNDLHDMGGLWKNMKTTTITFLAGGLALAGLPPFSGFFSKDEILAITKETGHTALYWIGSITALLTAFYIFRLIFQVFFGKQKTEASEKAHESPKVMTIPLIILAVFSVVAGWIALPGIGPGFSKFMEIHPHHIEPNYLVMLLSTIIALIGVITAWAIYSKKFISHQKIFKTFYPISKTLENKYWVDELYHYIFVLPVIFLTRILFAFDMYVIDGIVNGTGWLTTKLARFEGAFDLGIIDGAVNGTSKTVKGIGQAFRRLQTGKIQEYLIIVSIGIIALIIFGYFLL